MATDRSGSCATCCHGIGRHDSLAAQGEQDAPTTDGDIAEPMTTADELSAQQSDERPRNLWRDPMWLGLVVVFIATSAVLIGAIAGRAAAIIDMWALAVGGLAVAAGAAASVAIAAWRQRARANETLSSQVFVQALPHACAIINATGRADVANDMFQQLFPEAEHAPLTALKQRIGDAAAADDLIGRLVAAAASGRVARKETEVVGAGGGREALCISAMPLADQDGSALWTFEDISARYKAAAETREAHASQAETLTSAPVGFYSVDQDGRFLLVNDLLASWLGYASGAIEEQALRLHDVLVAPSPYTLPYRFGDAADGETAAEHHIELQRLDGSALPVVVVQAENRQSDGLVRTSSIVHLRQIAHEAEPVRIQSEHRFERVFKNAPVGVVLLDDQGRVMESNQSWQLLVAPDEEKLSGRSITEFIDDDDVSKVDAWLARDADVRADVAPYDVTLRTKTAMGAPRIATMYFAQLACILRN